MSRNAPFILLVTGLTVAMVLAGLAGRSAAPSDAMTDQRRSIFLQGPNGASGFAEVLGRFGVEVDHFRRPLFHIADDSQNVAADDWIAVLDLTVEPMGREREQILRHVERGGGLLVVGSTGLERCFGLGVFDLEESTPTLDISSEDQLYDPPRHRYGWIEDEGEPSVLRLSGESEDECAVTGIESSAPLLRTTAGDVIAWRFGFIGGGRAILLAEARYVSNEALRDTEVGLLVLPWLLDERPERFTFDEYHQGFSEGGSMLGATWSWMTSSPVGGALLQLAFAGLVLLLALAIRFGPALQVIQRERRSPMEHLTALAVGLERAGGHTEAVRLIANGLRRRLSRSVLAGHYTHGDMNQWLSALGMASRGKGARAAVGRLSARLRSTNNTTNDVLEAAQAVEDVWEALRKNKTLKQS
jgi:hypothetical protein